MLSNYFDVATLIAEAGTKMCKKEKLYSDQSSKDSENFNNKKNIYNKNFGKLNLPMYKI